MTDTHANRPSKLVAASTTTVNEVACASAASIRTALGAVRAAPPNVHRVFLECKKISVD
jgi:hypothetical protein